MLAMTAGMRDTTAEVRASLESNGALRERVGTIRSFEMDVAATLAADRDEYVFVVEGTLGKGSVRARCAPDAEGREEVRSASLELAGGERVELVAE